VRDGSGAVVGDGEGEHVSLVSGEPGAAAVAGEVKPSDRIRHGCALVQSKEKVLGFPDTVRDLAGSCKGLILSQF
jgi:hypothetical protein